MPACVTSRSTSPHSSARVSRPASDTYEWRRHRETSSGSHSGGSDSRDRNRRHAGAPHGPAEPTESSPATGAPRRSATNRMDSRAACGHGDDGLGVAVDVAEEDVWLESSGLETHLRWSRRLGSDHQQGRPHALHVGQSGGGAGQEPGLSGEGRRSGSDTRLRPPRCPGSAPSGRFERGEDRRPRVDERHIQIKGHGLSAHDEILACAPGVLGARNATCRVPGSAGC